MRKAPRKCYPCRTKQPAEEGYRLRREWWPELSPLFRATPEKEAAKRSVSLAETVKSETLAGTKQKARTATMNHHPAEAGAPPIGPAPIVDVPIIDIKALTKTYDTGYAALKGIDLQIRRGEIFALLGPNGAGKTTLISVICGIVSPSSGTIRADGHDILRDFRKARAAIGLVPQELTTDAFETVWATVSFSRGLFGKRANPAHIEKILRQLSLWDKKDAKIMTLSGGMKRRVLIAKALSHEPTILFLDEPTAGVDVQLRQDMWNVVRELRDSGVTIILTTHYIEEAEEMADRIGVISKGEIILVEEKAELMRKLGKKQLRLALTTPLDAIPDALAPYGLERSADGAELLYTYDTKGPRTGITALLGDLAAAGITFRDLSTHQSSLEDIFVSLVGNAK